MSPVRVNDNKLKWNLDYDGIMIYNNLKGYIGLIPTNCKSTSNTTVLIQYNNNYLLQQIITFVILGRN